jgi:hypothetical protein
MDKAVVEKEASVDRGPSILERQAYPEMVPSASSPIR